MPLRPVAPMLATLAAQAPRGDDWTYEAKFDGYRVIAVKDGRRVTLVSRNGKDMTRMYPSVTAAVGTVAAATALIDGEIIALDEDGRPSFQALHHQTARTTVYYAFDLLHLDGRDLTRATLDERRAALARVVDGSRVFRSEPLPGTLARIEKAIRALKMEGIVAKRGRSLYEPGARTKDWIKVKFNQRQEFVIGGFTPAASGFDGLVVGYYDGTRLRFAGRVRAGFTAHDRGEIARLLAPHPAARCPFVDLPSLRTGHWGEGVTPADMAKIHWVKPKVVVDVSFVEWTREGALRHSRFVGLRTDKKPRDVRRESGDDVTSTG